VATNIYGSHSAALATYYPNTAPRTGTPTGPSVGLV